MCDKVSTWNHSNCECECDKLCDVGEYLDYEICKCWKKLIDKLIERNSAEECTKNVEEVKIAKMALFEHENECMFLHNLRCLGCNSLSNQHWNWCSF